MAALSNRPQQLSANVEFAPPEILIIDDDPHVAGLLVDLLGEELGRNCHLHCCGTLGEARQILARAPRIGCILCDQILPDGLGTEFIAEVSARGLAAILMTGHGSEEVAVQAMKAGACEYVNKIKLSGVELANMIRRAVASARVTREIAEPARELRQARQDLDHFLRAISHDLGANMLLLESSVEALKQEPEVEKIPAARANFSHMEACLRQSNKFLGDLVTLARTGTIEMQAECVQPSQIAEQVLFEQRRLLESRGIEVELQGDMPSVMVNALRLKQVFTNLVRNAAKHGCAAEQPRIRIEAITHRPTTLEPANSRANPAFEQNHDVWLAVRDNGRGIPPADREGVFLPGKRLASAHPEGSGMGLAIVKKIIDFYGGQILIEDYSFEKPELGGTSMLFSLPRGATRSES
ncbi:MAG: ATP-binding protein [Pirellulales bacterium]|nr:ATP-binding protein [Pirellulales bacterium]